MVDYKKLYLRLFNATEDAINAMEDATKTMEHATKALIQAQQDCEEIYISDPDPEPETVLELLPRQGASEKVPEGDGEAVPAVP